MAEVQQALQALGSYRSGYLHLIKGIKKVQIGKGILFYVKLNDISFSKKNEALLKTIFYSFCENFLIGILLQLYFSYYHNRITGNKSNLRTHIYALDNYEFASHSQETECYLKIGRFFFLKKIPTHQLYNLTYRCLALFLLLLCLLL